MDSNGQSEFLRGIIEGALIQATKPGCVPRRILHCFIVALVLCSLSCTSGDDSDNSDGLINSELDQARLIDKVDSLIARSRPDSAVQVLEDFLESERGSDGLELKTQYIEPLFRLSECYFRMCRYNDADSALRGVEAIVATLDRADSLRALVLIHRADLYGAQRRFHSSIDLLLEAVDILKERYGEDSPILALAYEPLTRAYFTSLDFKSHAHYAELLLRDLTEMFGVCHVSVIETSYRLALSYRELGWTDREREILEAALESLECTDSVSAKLVMDVKTNLGVLLRKQGEGQPACAMLEEALRAAEEYFGRESKGVIEPLHLYGDCLATVGDLEKAAAVFQHLIELSSAKLGRLDANTLDYRRIWGNLLMHQGKPEEAAKVLVRTLEDAEITFATDSLELVEYLSQYGWSLLMQFKVSEAAPHLERSWRLAHLGYPPNNPRLLKPLQGLTRLRQMQGNEEEVRRLQELASSIANRDSTD